MAIVLRYSKCLMNHIGSEANSRNDRVRDGVGGVELKRWLLMLHISVTHSSMIHPIITVAQLLYSTLSTPIYTRVYINPQSGLDGMLD